MTATNTATEPSDFTSMMSEDSELALINIEPFYGTASFQTDQSIRLFFNKTVVAGSGDIILSNGSDIRTIAANDASQVVFEEDTVIISPSTNLAENTTYTLQIASGVIVDTADSAYAGINNFNFTTIAASNPQMLAGGTNGLTEFQVDQNIQLYFDETVKANAGNIIISNGTDTRTIAINDASQVTFSGSKISIDPTEDLLGDTAYSIQIADGVIADLEGNTYAGSSNIMFATITTDPEILNSNPTNHSTLKSDANIELFFNRTVTAGQGDIILSNGTDTRTIPIDDTSQVMFNFSTVTINPADDLIVGATYTVQMAKGVITDTADHDYAGLSDASIAIVASNPLLAYSAPFDHSTLVVDGQIELYFDEPVMAGSGSIIFTNGTDTRTIPIDDVSQVTFNSHSVTINPTEDLLAGTTYTVQMTQGVIVDTAGHTYAGFTDAEVTTISSDPFITSSNLNTRSTLKNDDDIQLYFNEAVEVGSGNIVISNGSDIHTIAIDDTRQVTFSKYYDPFFVSNFDSNSIVEQPEATIVTINPTTDLVANTEYTVQIDKGIVTDTTGHEFAGFSDATFSTRISDPLLIDSQPEEGEAFKVDDDIQLYFDETVQAGNGNIVISNGSDTRTIAIDDISQIAFSPDVTLNTAISVAEGTNSEIIFGRETTLTINPIEDLIPNTTYNIQIDSGVIVDTTGNAYAGLNDTTFSTITSEPLLSPINTSEESTIKTDDDIELRFDETVVAGSGDIILSNGPDTRMIAINDPSQVTIFANSVIINPTEDLFSDTTYSIQIANGVITDEAGNPYVGSSSTMVKASNPLLTYSNPIDGSLIKTDGNIILQFDEPIVAGSGNITLSNGSDTRTIAFNDTSQVTFNGSKVAVIDPTEDLIGDTTYSVQMDNGAITDEAGNPYAGFNNVTVTTTDVPLLSFPPDENVVSTRDNITLIFDEVVVAGEGDIIISNGTDIRMIAVDDTSQVSFVGEFGNMNIVTINPFEDLEADTTYQIQIASGVIVDTDGNSYKGISEADMFEFKVMDFGTDPFAPLL